MLDIVFGENAGTIPAQSLQTELTNLGVSGNLYLGYPVLSTADGKVFVDALLVSESHGLIAFDLSSKIEGGRPTDAEKSEIADRQNQIYASIYNKLNTHASLRRGRSLAVEVGVVTYHTGLAEPFEDGEVVATPPAGLPQVMKRFGGVPSDVLRPLKAAVQRVSTLRPPNKREHVVRADSRGAILKRIEREIANLDNWQNKGAIEYANGPQRIRGLAGSGKTVVLALKAAYLHVRHPEWRIAVTFSSRALYQQFRDLIRRFTYDQIEDDPDWNRLLVMHAWGSTRESGVYSTVCSHYGIVPVDWRTANERYGSRSFEGVCVELNKAIAAQVDKPAVFDAVLVDEAQDQPTAFYRMLYSVVPRPHRIMWAYDDLQNLGDYEMRSEEVLFGSDAAGEPLVRLRNEANKPREDIVLPVCYRNTPWALATAHALGFGIYRPQGLIQMFDEASIWPRIGYEVTGGQLELGHRVRLQRRPESYPAYFPQLLDPADAVQARVFGTEEEQYEALALAIRQNLQHDELDHSDILIVLPNTYTSKKVGARVMSALARAELASHLVGVTTSRDEVFQRGSVAITHIHRAKGNEAAMVYIVNSEYCHGGFELSRKRNILFTAITRSRCWVRIFGVGEGMAGLAAECELVRGHSYELDFDYPSQEQIEKMARVHRDMPEHEKRQWQGKFTAIEDVLRAVEAGEVPVDALPKSIRDKLGLETDR
ncbi:DEAD/DEAH box helicase [Bradyrhizobium sp. 521_C7_N1_3]|uniref:DEAD/DEAH box helicase n=1 Tax=Bradyrhizobium sp. 521_C7_N1_3 TaxID=3240368 RepID=UPI003F8C071D